MLHQKMNYFVPDSDFEVRTVPEIMFYFIFHGENHLLTYKEINELEQYDDVYVSGFQSTFFFLKLQLLKMT